MTDLLTGKRPVWYKILILSSGAMAVLPIAPVDAPASSSLRSPWIDRSKAVRAAARREGQPKEQENSVSLQKIPPIHGSHLTGCGNDLKRRCSLPMDSSSSLYRTPVVMASAQLLRLSPTFP